MDLTQIKWIRAIGLSFLRDQKRKEEKGRGKERRRGRGREEERKIQRYGTLYRFVWIHVCGLWVVRNLTLE